MGLWFLLWHVVPYKDAQLCHASLKESSFTTCTYCCKKCKTDYYLTEI